MPVQRAYTTRAVWRSRSYEACGPISCAEHAPAIPTEPAKVQQKDSAHQCGSRSRGWAGGAVILLSTLGALIPGCAWCQVPKNVHRLLGAPVRPAIRRLVKQMKPRPNLQVDAEARRLVLLYLRRGIRQPYTGEEITRLLQGRVVESRQTVTYGGPGRVRMEYISPPSMKGEILLVTGGRIYQYRPYRGEILDGVASYGELVERVKEIAEGLRSGRISARVVGDELVAGIWTTIVEIHSVRGNEWFLRFWIDPKTGVRLRFMRLDAQGRAVAETTFASITYLQAADPHLFSPASLPSVPHVPRLPNTPPLPTVEAAQAQVAYAIRVPVLPGGYHLSGVWVVPDPFGRKTTILRFTDGVNNLALFETPLPPGRGRAAVAPRIRPRLGLAHWMAGGLAFTLIGHLEPVAYRQIADSLR